MEEPRKIYDLLDPIPQPGLWVREDRICRVNQAAAALLLAPGQAFSPLLSTGVQEYGELTGGDLCVTLSLSGIDHRAVIRRTEDGDLVLLEMPEESAEFRSMALVSMELRGPLMQAISGARQLTARTDDPAAAKMNRSLMQLLRMVSSMADVGRYSAGCRMEVRDVDSFLAELFEKAAALTEGQVTLTYRGLAQPVFSRIDPEQLERAVWNILSNCIKFTPAGGTVQAALTRSGQTLRLTVCDSGSGIAEAVRGTLFSRYLRQPGIEDSRYGLGLGLSLIRSAAANHGGTVLIRSSAAGGTQITLTLALRQDAEAVLRSPLLRPDYAGGWDHGLLELSDCLDPRHYAEL